MQTACWSRGVAGCILEHIVNPEILLGLYFQAGIILNISIILIISIILNIAKSISCLRLGAWTADQLPGNPQW